ncbi:MAG: Na+/H+ antiporter NhaA [Arsenophonus sp.]|nr:MAG: Na+/H+ antiporter NhaA [Arsenophonus sp.]
MTAIIRQFLKLETAGGILLIIAAILALVMANTPLKDIYYQFLNISLSFRIGILNFDQSILLWINDGLMSIFFLVVGLEVKREFIEGSLVGRDKALFPVIAAIGGMLFPAMVYLFFNADNKIIRHGWAIPTATDIAFALGVITLLGKRVPTELKVFLLALAIIDDIGVIFIIALFYTKFIFLKGLSLGILIILIMVWLNWRKVENIFIYLFFGIILWIFILKSGIHATLSGFIVGCVIPLKGHKNYSPSRCLQKFLHPWISYLILPLFAFANSGIEIYFGNLRDLFNTLPIGVALGLLFGKPIGISLFTWIAIKLKVIKLQKKINIQYVFAVSVLCGIGFTMSIFIASLAFEDLESLKNHAKLGILVGSTLSAIFGLFLLNFVLPKK